LKTKTIPEDGGSRFLRKLVAAYEIKVHGAIAQRLTIWIYRFAEWQNKENNFPPVLCGCQTWPLTWKVEHSSRIFESNVFR